MSDLPHSLDSIGLGQYAELFATNDIDRELLQELDDRDLASLGISFGHRKKLLKALAADKASSSGVSRVHELQSIAEGLGVKPERRHLTVLFCDMVGSTALSSRLDPEELRNILHEFQSCCGEAIRRYDGHVARFMGDGVLAYFGFPTAHEDDAERAVNAALSIKELLVRSEPVSDIEVRIGIATGLVVIGDLIGEGPTREFAIIGEAPYLAASLQHLPKPNQVLISDPTRRLIGSVFEVEDLGRRSIKGIEHQVPVYCVLRAAAIGSRFEAHRSSQLVPMIARESNWAFWKRASAARSGARDS